MGILKTIGEWIVLLPVWRRYIDSPTGRIAAAVGTGIVWFVLLAGISALSGSEEDSDNSENVAEAPATESDDEEEDDETVEPTASPTQIPTLEPTPVPTPSPSPVPTAPPAVDLQGVGQFVTDPINLPSPVSIATFTHNGGSNFIVTTFAGSDEELLINEIGPYQGSRPLFGTEPIFFEVQADGAWTIHIEAPSVTDNPAFSGRGDAVSALFIPTDSSSSPWEVAHDGTSNFIVYLHCADGSDLVQNEIGAITGSTVVSLGEGPCLWEVEADGNWSLTPR